MKVKESFLRLQIKTTCPLKIDYFLPCSEELLFPLLPLEEKLLKLQLYKNTLITLEGHAIHVLNHFTILVKTLTQYTFLLNEIEDQELKQGFSFFEKKYQSGDATLCSPDQINTALRNCVRSKSLSKSDLVNWKNSWFDERQAWSFIWCLANDLCLKYFGNLSFFS